MRLSTLLPRKFSTRLIIVIFISGFIPFLIFGFLMNTFDRRFRVQIDQAIQKGQEEEDRRSTALLREMAEKSIRQKALDVALQLELYLKAHPGMTIEELQKDPAFREIAVQPVGKTGYTAVQNSESAVNLFHKNPDIENMDLHSLADKLPGFWSIMKESLGGKYSSGYYQWKDIQGKTRRKFMYIAPVGREVPATSSAESADGVRLGIAATTYADEFTRPIRIARNVSHGTARYLTMIFHSRIRSFMNKGFLYMGIGLVLVLGLAFLIGIFFSRDLERLREATRSVVQGDLGVYVRPTTGGDMGELAEDFNRMVFHLKTATVGKEELEEKHEELREANASLQREIRERESAEEKLRESEEELRAIFEANPDPVVVYDNKGHPQYLNPAFVEVFGWSLDELRGQRIPFVPDHQKEATEENIGKLYSSGRPLRLETQRLTKGGMIVDILISAAPVKGREGKTVAMVVNLRDITEKKRMEVQLQQVQKMEALGTLAGGIAHNFNNALTGIQGRISLMLMDKDPSHSDFEHLKAMEEYVKNAAAMTSDLLGYARGGKYEVKPTDLNSLIRHESRMFGKTKKEIRIHEEYEKDLWSVEVDQGQIRQMLMNLYVNAWQVMPGGGELYVQTENVTIREDYVRPFEFIPGKYVKISVTDTGTGMDEATKDKIFEPFFTTRETGQGTGLGLSSVYGIVKNHGGFINVYSERGEGTTFNIYLPALGPEGEEGEQERKEDQDIQKGEGTVLLVDDEEIITDVGKMVLNNLGYGVLVAKSGKEAVDIYKENREEIDMVILDMVMPGMGGGETYERLKEIDPQIKVLLSSGYSINGQAREILDQGCNGFIQKPFDMKDLSSKVREILDRA